MLSDFVNRSTHKQNRWMVQPGPIVYMTRWEMAEKAMTLLASVTVIGLAVVFGVMIMAGA